MKILIQTQDFTAKQELLNLVEEKLNKLDRFSDQIIESRVTLRVEKSEKRNNKIFEVRMAIPGNDLFVKKQSESFEEAIHLASDALQRQIKDWKEKLRA